jgi:hypothetical protein
VRTAAVVAAGAAPNLVERRRERAAAEVANMIDLIYQLKSIRLEYEMNVWSVLFFNSFKRRLESLKLHRKRFADERRVFFSVEDQPSKYLPKDTAEEFKVRVVSRKF